MSLFTAQTSLPAVHTPTSISNLQRPTLTSIHSISICHGTHWDSLYSVRSTRENAIHLR